MFPFFELQRNNHILFWNGIQHSRDESHPQFQELKNNWERFFKIATSPLVVVEHQRSKSYTNEEESIKNGGEVGFITFLADKITAPVKCFEPDRHYEMNHLAKLFGKEKTEYHYFARVITQWYKVVKNGSIKEYISPFLKRDQNASDWANFDFSINHMEQIHKNLFGNELNFNDKNFFFKIDDPNCEDNLLKDVVLASDIYRDKSIIEGIKTVWKNNDIFIVYGKDHEKAHRDELSGLN